MVVVLPDPRFLLELGQTSAEWLEKVVSTKRRREESQAATILRDAGMLTAALRALGTSWRTTMSKILLVSPDWPEEQRAELKAELLAYLMEEVVVGEIRKSAAALDWYVRSVQLRSRGPGAMWDDVLFMVTSADKVLLPVIAHEYSPFWQLDHLLDEVVDQGAADRKRWKDTESEARRLLEVIEPMEIAAVESAFGRLKATILAEYPSLPEPTWAIPMASSR